MHTIARCLALISIVAAGCGGSSAKPAGQPAPPTAAASSVDGAATPAAPMPVASSEQSTASDDPAADPAANDAAAVLAQLESEEKGALAKAMPVFDKHCAKCHKTGGKKAKPKTLAHFSMDAYPFGGHHAADMTKELRSVLGLSGGKATMPIDRPGAVQGDELAAMKALLDAADSAAAAR